ncbi:MAG: undecaprenyl-diphosphate phosphatase [Holosporaceae bacterium]|jgi:undecaprenyl-diphosphatase|nr:undecaprenyl-diphosphate phosphatase [Holosporaceae bacterium]
MTFCDAFLLGAIQGVTEFLPVSSSAHVDVFAHLSGLPRPSDDFGIFVNCGSLLAVLIFFRYRIRNIWRGGVDFISGRKTADRSFFATFVLSSIPVTIVYAAGMLLRIRIDSIKISAVLLIVFAVVLYFCDQTPVRDRKISGRDSILTGIVQSLSFFPGVSRLGICMSAMRYLKYSREESFRHSLLLYIPPVSAACCAQLIKIAAGKVNENLLIGLTGLASSFLFGLIFLPFVLKFLQKHTLLPVIAYRILFGALLLAREMKIISAF